MIRRIGHTTARIALDRLANSLVAAGDDATLRGTLLSHADDMQAVLRDYIRECEDAEIAAFDSADRQARLQEPTES